MRNERRGLFRSAAPDVSYARTLEYLRGHRNTPVLEPRLSIGGEIERSVHAEIEREREDRIKEMHTRLRGVRGHVANAFGVSRIAGHAVRDFEHSR